MGSRSACSSRDSTPTVNLNGKTVSNAILAQPGTALQKLIQGAR